MRRRHKHKRLRRTPQRGSVMLEGVILIPVLIMLVGCLVVMGVRLSNYMFLSQIGRELIVKMGTVPWLAEVSSVAGESGGGNHIYPFVLGPNTFDPSPVPTEEEVSLCVDALNDAAHSTACSGTLDADCMCPLKILQWYATKLVAAKNLRVRDDVNLNFSFGPDPANPGSGLCVVTVELWANDPGAMGYFAGDIRVSASGPYVSSPVPSMGSNCRLF